MDTYSLKNALLLKDRGVISMVGAGGKTTLMFRLAGELVYAGKTVLTTTTTKILMPSPWQSSHVILSNTPDKIIEKATNQKKPHSHITVGMTPEFGDEKIQGLSPKTVQLLWETGRFDWIIVEADGASRRSLKAPASHEPVIPNITRYVIALIGLDVVGKPLIDKWVFRSSHYSQITGLPIHQFITPSSIAEAVIHKKGVFKGSPPGALKIVFLNKADDEGTQNIGRQIAAILKDKGRNIVDRVIMGATKEDQIIKQLTKIKNESQTG